MGAALALLLLGGITALVAVAVLVAGARSVAARSVAARSVAARSAAARGVALPLLAASGLLALAGLAFVLVVSDETLGTADAPVLGWLVAHRTPTATVVAEVLSLLGGTVVTGGAAVVAAVVLLARGRRVRAVTWIVGVLTGATTIRVLKVVVERPRPPMSTRLTAEATYSLPSGHSLMAALGLGLVALAVGTLAGRTARVVTTALVVVAVLAIGASRAYLGVHWTTDVVAGWLLGSAFCLACLAAARAGESASSPRSPIEETTRG